jgi:hypothetical protein
MVAMNVPSVSDPLSWTPRHLTRRTGLLLLAGYLALSVWAWSKGTTVDPTRRNVSFERSDSGLYRAIVHRMDDGQGYYAAVAAEQPGRGYPTSPFVTVREPTLAWITSALGKDVTVALLWTLVAASLLLSVWVYERTEQGRIAWWVTVCAAVAATGIFAFPGGVYTHEVWMSLLVYLALVTRGLGWVRTSVLLLVGACLVRELVAPVLVLMLLVAWCQGRRREVLWWAGGCVTFALLFGAHAMAVHRLVEASGPASSSWLALGGWPFVVDALREPSLLSVAPYPVVAALVPLGVLGWVARRGPFFDRVSIVLLSYLALFCFVGRPDNAYWGAFLAVFVVIGLAMVLVGGGRRSRQSRWSRTSDTVQQEGL